MRQLRAFTLVELLVVMAIVALLVTIAAPRYFTSIDRSKESVLKQTLSVTRDAVDKYYGDHGAYPETLDVLVTKRYLRSLPVDPLTGLNTSWVIVAPNEPEKGRIYDLHSGAEGTGHDGKPYRDW